VTPPLVVNIAPTLRTERRMAFVDYSTDPPDPRNGFQETDWLTADKSPEGIALRDLRVEVGASLGDAARLLGITVVELSSLERGIAVLSAADWTRATDALRAAKGGAR
jgi:hypothetical protein